MSEDKINDPDKDSGINPGSASGHESELARKFLWVDDPGKVNSVIKGLIIFCVVLFVLDFVIHRHSYFSVEKWYGFYGIAGFGAFTLIVLGAKNLRRIIRRDENYYGAKAVDAEEYPVEQDETPGSSGNRP